MDIDTSPSATPGDASARRPVKTLLIAVLWCVATLCLYAVNAVNAVT
ncbi:MAG: hypothetical protein ACHP83_09355 [Burkholderiales bacterium]|jgi:hypothetical protein